MASMKITNSCHMDKYLEPDINKAIIGKEWIEKAIQKENFRPSKSDPLKIFSDIVLPFIESAGISSNGMIASEIKDQIREAYV